MKRGTIPLLVGAILSCVGVVFLIVGVAIGADTVSFLASAERTEGVVVELTERTSTSRDTDGHTRTSTTWYPTVEFSTGAGETVTFESSVGSDPPTHDVGEEVPVAYDPANPSDAKVATGLSLYLLPLIFGGLGVVLSAVGIPLLIVGIRKKRVRRRLLRDGTEVWAEISEVGVEFNVRINRRHPYVVRATWHDPRTGRTHHATSDYLTRDPGPDLRGRTHVRVQYDPENPDENVMDLRAAAPLS